jgi:hypothetical protein
MFVTEVAFPLLGKDSFPGQGLHGATSKKFFRLQILTSDLGQSARWFANLSLWGLNTGPIAFGRSLWGERAGIAS